MYNKHCVCSSGHTGFHERSFWNVDLITSEGLRFTSYCRLSFTFADRALMYLSSGYVYIFYKVVLYASFCECNKNYSNYMHITFVFSRFTFTFTYEITLHRTGLTCRLNHSSHCKTKSNICKLYSIVPLEVINKSS